MKTRFITAILLLAALVGSSLNAQAAWPGKRCKGSGKLITREFAVAPFTALEVSNGANVTLTTGSGPAVVETDDNMMEYVEVKVEDGTLTIGFEGECTSLTNVTLRVTVPTDGRLNRLRLSGASKIVAEPVLQSKNLKLRLSGASKLVAVVKCGTCTADLSGASKAEVGGDMDACEAEVSGASNLNLVAKAGRCLLDASGASKINASGSANFACIEVSGASNLNAEDFVTTTCIVSASGASNARVNCSSKLTAEASSASKITYSGNCTNNTIESSGASTVKRK